jgi:hypothetical protein
MVGKNRKNRKNKNLLTTSSYKPMKKPTFKRKTGNSLNSTFDSMSLKDGPFFNVIVDEVSMQNGKFEKFRKKRKY